MYRLFESVCVFLFRSSSALVFAHRAAIFRLRKVANGAKVLAINGATDIHLDIYNGPANLSSFSIFSFPSRRENRDQQERE